jgi:hypothetical protein
LPKVDNRASKCLISTPKSQHHFTLDLSRVEAAARYLPSLDLKSESAENNPRPAMDNGVNHTSACIQLKDRVDILTWFADFDDLSPASEDLSQLPTDSSNRNALLVSHRLFVGILSTPYYVCYSTTANPTPRSSFTGRSWPSTPCCKVLYRLQHLLLSRGSELCSVSWPFGTLLVFPL